MVTSMISTPAVCRLPRRAVTPGTLARAAYQRSRGGRPMAEGFDVVILGAGPGGAEHVAKHCRRAALVEREVIDGECTNWGCTPSMLLRATELRGKGPCRRHPRRRSTSRARHTATRWSRTTTTPSGSPATRRGDRVLRGGGMDRRHGLGQGRRRDPRGRRHGDRPRGGRGFMHSPGTRPKRGARRPRPDVR
jgi:hypothetical protein